MTDNIMAYVCINVLMLCVLDYVEIHNNMITIVLMLINTIIFIYLLNKSENKMENRYLILINFLQTATEEQLCELYADVDNLETIERIADTAYRFVEQANAVNSFENDEHNNDEAELVHADNRQRYKDIKSTMDALK